MQKLIVAIISPKGRCGEFRPFLLPSLVKLQCLCQMQVVALDAIDRWDHVHNEIWVTGSKQSQHEDILFTCNLINNYRQTYV